MKTAVEFLVDKLSYTTSDGTIISHHFFINKLVEQAKAMEREQIVKAYTDTLEFSPENIAKGEQYYNVNYKDQVNESA